MQAVFALLEGNDEKALFLVLFVEEAGIPLPMPGDLVIMFAGYRAAVGSMDLFEAGLAVTLGVQMGSTILYLLSRRIGHSLLRHFGRYMHLNAERLELIEASIQRRGPAMVFVGRLTPGLRIPTSIAAGCFGIPFHQFLFYTTLAAATWSLFWLALGYIFGDRLLPVMETLHGPSALLGGLALALASVAGVIWYYMTRMRGREARPAGAWRLLFRTRRLP